MTERTLAPAPPTYAEQLLAAISEWIGHIADCEWTDAAGDRIGFTGKILDVRLDGLPFVEELLIDVAPLDDSAAGHALRYSLFPAPTAYVQIQAWPTVPYKAPLVPDVAEVTTHALESDVSRALGQVAPFFNQADTAPPAGLPTWFVTDIPQDFTPDGPDDPWANEPLFQLINGTAGTGKTWNQKRRSEVDPRVKLTATTGIAAINLGGQTINSLLGYKDTPELSTNFELGKLSGMLSRLAASGFRRLIIDEVSMMDGKQLDILCEAIDRTNERLSHEGEPLMGITLVGDFCQLPPVKAQFVFERPSFGRFVPATARLTEPRRQADPDFVRALQAVRRADLKAAVDYFGPLIKNTIDSEFSGSTIMAKNDEVDRHNALRLQELQGKEVVFKPTRAGVQASEWKNIPDTNRMKIGALVMILSNKREKGTYFHGEEDIDVERKMIYANGDLGILVDVLGSDPDAAIPNAPAALVKLHRNGQIVTVEEVEREYRQPTGLKGADPTKPREQKTGSIRFMPLRIAWATTCHKCVAFDTRVDTGNAIVPISALHIGAVLRTGGPVLALAATTRQGFRIVTQRGYTIVASAEHRWATDQGWVTTHDLYEKRASIALCVGTCDYYAEDNYAWWLGAMVGNGTYNDRREGQLHFATTNAALGGRWQQLTHELGTGKVSWRKDRRGLHTTQRALRLRLLADGLDYATCKGKRVPSYVWKGGPSAWRSFIRGLFDCDGSVSRSSVVLTTAAETLGIEVQELLLALGVVSDRHVYPGKVDPYWQIRIPAASLTAFRQIGFWHPLKAAALAKLSPNRVIRAFTGYDAVVDVKDLEILVPMVDVEVDAPHVIGTGPFRSHNSQGLSLDAAQVVMNNGFFGQPGMLYVALSRARTPEGLRLVGSGASQLKNRIKVDPKVVPYL